MGSSKRETRKYTSIIIFAFLLIIGCFYLFMTINSLRIELAEKSIIITQLDEKISNQNEIITSLQDDIAYYDSLENKIIELKQIYFTNAAKADELARNDEANFKVCYLTFDDGPYLLTDKFLDILEEKDVLATFFTLKKTNELYLPIYQREKINGHTIGNHTAHHTIRNGIYRSNEAFINDILENRQFIYEMLGITTNVMRFPGGNSQPAYMGLNRDLLVDKLNEIGYGYVGWSHATGDGGSVLSPDEYLHNVIDYTSNSKVIVILMHDYSENTAKCLPEMIDELTRQGYIFLPLWYDSPVVKKGS